MPRGHCAELVFNKLWKIVRSCTELRKFFKYLMSFLLYVFKIPDSFIYHIPSWLKLLIIPSIIIDIEKGTPSKTFSPFSSCTPSLYILYPGETFRHIFTFLFLLFVLYLTCISWTSRDGRCPLYSSLKYVVNLWYLESCKDHFYVFLCTFKIFECGS